MARRIGLGGKAAMAPCAGVAAALALGAAGCAAVPGADLADTRWQAERIAGRDAAPSVQTTLRFDADAAITGTGGCNAFRGEVLFGPGNALSVDRIAGTQRACPEPAMEQELRFLQALTSADHYDRENGMLVIFNGEGAPVLRFGRLAEATGR